MRVLPAGPPAQLLWWFHNIGGTMRYGDQVLPRYLVWHPLDHIHWELDRPDPHGGTGEGARFRIVTVEKLDHTGIRLVRRLAGVPVLQLEHTWSPGDGRAHYVSVLDVGARARLSAPVNRYLTSRVFPESLLRAWVVHNIEEVGILEHLLPEQRAQLQPVPA